MTWFHERVSMTKSLLTLALLVGALVGFAPAPPASAACSCTAQAIAGDTERLARNANDVFTGTVTSSTTASREDGANGAVFVHQVQVGLVYKGDVRDEVLAVQTTSGGPCDLGQLPTGTPYAFFVGVADGVLVADGCGGTQRKRANLVTELETLYGEGQPPRQERPAEEAVIEEVGVAAPVTFSRAAAPGAALVLVGLLGLVVVRRLARRG